MKANMIAKGFTAMNSLLGLGLLFFSYGCNFKSSCVDTTPFALEVTIGDHFFEDTVRVIANGTVLCEDEIVSSSPSHGFTNVSWSFCPVKKKISGVRLNSQQKLYVPNNDSAVHLSVRMNGVDYEFYTRLADGAFVTLTRAPANRLLINQIPKPQNKFTRQ